MVMAVMQKANQFHRKNAKGRRECFVGEKKIPGPVRGKFCVIPRPIPAITGKMRKK